MTKKHKKMIKRTFGNMAKWSATITYADGDKVMLPNGIIHTFNGDSDEFFTGLCDQIKEQLTMTIAKRMLNKSLEAVEASAIKTVERHNETEYYFEDGSSLIYAEGEFWL